MLISLKFGNIINAKKNSFILIRNRFVEKLKYNDWWGKVQEKWNEKLPYASVTIDNFSELLTGNLTIFSAPRVYLPFISTFLHTFCNCKLCKSQWTAFNYKSTQLASSTLLQRYLQNVAKTEFSTWSKTKTASVKMRSGDFLASISRVINIFLIHFKFSGILNAETFLTLVSEIKQIPYSQMQNALAVPQFNFHLHILKTFVFHSDFVPAFNAFFKNPVENCTIKMINTNGTAEISYC